MSAALTFVAVLLGLTAVTQTPRTSAAVRRSRCHPSSAVLVDGQLVVPVRLSDPAVVTLLDPGDVVDVMVATERGGARLVAADLTVTAVPDADSGGTVGRQ